MKKPSSTRPVSAHHKSIVHLKKICAHPHIHIHSFLKEGESLLTGEKHNFYISVPKQKLKQVCTQTEHKKSYSKLDFPQLHHTSPLIQQELLLQFLQLFFRKDFFFVEEFFKSLLWRFKVETYHTFTAFIKQNFFLRQLFICGHIKVQAWFHQNFKKCSKLNNITSRVIFRFELLQ